jgi:hypothetical protein
MFFLMACTDLSFAQNKIYSTLKASAIKGQVKIIEQRSYSVDRVNPDSLIQDSCCINKEEYDVNGNLTKSETYNIKGEFNSGRLFSYYPNGLIKKIEYIDKERKETYREEFVLNATGNYEGGSGYREGILHRTYKIPSQNEYGLWTKFSWYSLDGKLYRAEEFSYDGNRLVRTIWKVDDKIDRDEQKMYNEKGENTFTKSTGSRPFFNFESKKRTDTYDSLGNITQYSLLDADDRLTKVIKRIYYYR